MIITLILCLLVGAVVARPIVLYFADSNGLRKYPNQNLFSGLTSLCYLWERSFDFRTKRLYFQHQENPIIRVAPNTLSFGDVRAIKDIYGHGSPCQKHDMYQLTASGHSHILNVINREEHSRKRRMLSNAFATRNLENWEFKIADKVEKLIAQLDRLATPKLIDSASTPVNDLTVNWRLWSNLFTIDAIADIAMSEKLHLLESGTDAIMVDGCGASEKLHFLASMHEGARVTSLFIGAPDWFRLLKAASRAFLPSFRFQWECGQRFGKIVSHLANKRLQKHEQGEDLDDFIRCLIQDRLGKSRDLDHGEIEAETNILLDAGSDTTAIALTHVLYYLIRRQECLLKLRMEVAEPLAGETIAPYQKVKSLPYLKACLDESLRLSPPLPRGLERVTPPSGMKIMGESIPGNISVSVPAYVAHRDPVLFPDPEAFSPERWLENDKIDEMRVAFIPFSSGGRACIGRNITMMEQQILVATLVSRYDFALPSEDWEMKYEEAFNLWPARMPIKVWQRSV